MNYLYILSAIILLPILAWKIIKAHNEFQYERERNRRLDAKIAEINKQHDDATRNIFN